MSRPGWDCNLSDGRPKRKYYDENAALEAVDAMEDQVDKKFKHYFCANCGAFHVAPKNKSEARKARLAQALAKRREATGREIEVLGHRAAYAMMHESRSPEEYFEQLAKAHRKRVESRKRVEGRAGSLLQSEA